ncbi:MAG: DNA-processing protein DprA [Candidatus Saccharimonadales bacterium]
MKWLAVVGTREATEEMQRDISERVQAAVRDGWGIVTGGSTGVDTVAIMVAMQCGGTVRIYLPIALDDYATNLRERAQLGKCRAEDAALTIDALRELKMSNPQAVFEPAHTGELTPAAFYARNELVLQTADMVAAYHLEGNTTASVLRAGTLLTVDRAHEIDLPVELHQYYV